MINAQLIRLMIQSMEEEAYELHTLTIEDEAELTRIDLYQKEMLKTIPVDLAGSDPVLIAHEERIYSLNEEEPETREKYITHLREECETLRTIIYLERIKSNLVLGILRGE